MVVLAVYLVLLAGLWWIWLRTDSGRPSTRATAPALSPPGVRVAPDLRPHLRPVRRCGVDGPPLSEDDVIAFGLVLEGTEDVVRWAIADSRRATTEPQAQRDISGPSSPS